MMHSPTQTGTPNGSIWPSCRSAMTTLKLPYASTATTAAATA